MKREIIITSLGILFAYPVYADISPNELRQLELEHAPVMQALKNHPPDIQKEIEKTNSDEIKAAAENPRQMFLDFSEPDFDALVKQQIEQ